MPIDLPRPGGPLTLTDAGLETEMIFLRGLELPHFASHTLLGSDGGRAALADYFRGFLGLAARLRVPLVLSAPTWRAGAAWAGALGVDKAAVRKANLEAVAFTRACVAEAGGDAAVEGSVGPAGDAYDGGRRLGVNEAEAVHAEQAGWLAEAGVDLVTGLTFGQADEAAGFARAAVGAGLPVAVGFTVETDGRLPGGQTLAAAVEAVDEATGGAPRSYLVNCAHPSHVEPALTDGAWRRRLGGVRFNASRCSHAELDEAETLDDGDPAELARLAVAMAERVPTLSVFGGCCGTDLRHVTAMAEALLERFGGAGRTGPDGSAAQPRSSTSA